MTIRPPSRPVLVIGAGPAGIGAGIGLGHRGTVFEGSPSLGGLCRTLELEGAVFDLGGHSFHTPHPEVRDLVFDALEMHEQPRDARCLSHGQIIPYPFQTHFRQLADSAVVEECDRGLAAASGGDGAEHFEAYLEARFGPGIARHFLRPYNRKLWGTPLDRLAVDWVGERVAGPYGSATSFATAGGRRTPLAAATSVAYPARGGYGEIFRALAERLADLRLGERLDRIVPESRTAVTAGGETFRYERIVSTVPLPRLLERIDGVPETLIEEAGRLESLSLALVMVVLDRPVGTEIQRLYSADPEIPFHKLVLNHNSSPFLRSLPRHGILAEISFSRRKPLPASLADRVERSLREIGWIRSGDAIVARRIETVPLAYPLPTHDRTDIVRRVSEWLAERGIVTLGRFGQWAYINSDEALQRGLVVGRALAAE